jgi:hypothetical protein
VKHEYTDWQTHYEDCPECRRYQDGKLIPCQRWFELLLLEEQKK